MQNLLDLFRQNKRDIGALAQPDRDPNLRPLADPASRPRALAVATDEEKKAFFLAVRQGKPDAIDSTIAQYPDAVSWHEPDAQTQQTVLHIAAQLGHTETVQQLLGKQGIDVNARDTHGWTPLIYASSSSPTVLLDLLIHAGARIDAETMTGETALLHALKHQANLYRIMPDKNDFANVTRLIIAGADPRQKNSHGQSAFDIAKQHDFPALTLILIDASQKYSDYQAIKSGKQPVISVMKPLHFKKRTL